MIRDIDRGIPHGGRVPPTSSTVWLHYRNLLLTEIREGGTGTPREIIRRMRQRFGWTHSTTSHTLAYGEGPCFRWDGERWGLAVHLMRETT